MKKFGIFIWLLTFTLVACQSSSSAEHKEITDEDIARTVEATHIVEIEVEGMTCEMGCGGDIRKALRNTGGVSKVEFDFDDERTRNIAKVYYDELTINPNELKRVIEELNKGQFTTGAFQTTNLPVSSAQPDSKGKENAGSGIQMSNSFFSISDVAGIVASWFL